MAIGNGKKVTGGEGWVWPDGCAKAHYVVDGRSLCGRWGYKGKEFDGNKYPADYYCKACRSRLDRREKQAQSEAEKGSDLFAQDRPVSAISP